MSSNTDINRRSLGKWVGVSAACAAIVPPLRAGAAQTRTQSLRELPLSSFAIASDSALAERMRVNARYLLSLDVDRLLYSFRAFARLPTREAKPYGGWEGAEWGLRGHFVGHYLSAVARGATTMRAVDPAVAAEFRERGRLLVDGLVECQAAIARLDGPGAPGHPGYLNAQSSAQFDRLEALQPCDVPYYQIHKTMAGLLDAHALLGDSRALRAAGAMADYFAWRMDRLPPDRIAAMLETRRYLGDETTYFMEAGAMHEVVLRLWRLTGDPVHRRLADRFDRRWFLDSLESDRDTLGVHAQHANTEIANVFGLAQYHDLSGAPAYRAAVLNFLGWLADGHQFANGAVSGTSAYPRPIDYGGELFNNRHLLHRQLVNASVGKHDVANMSGSANRECGESCCSHNLNRLATYAMRWTGDARWGDEFENRFVNAVLAQQHPASGMLVYNLNLAPGSTKRYGTAEDSFWCCYGTGVEAFAALAEGAFFEEGRDALWINGFVPGTIDWHGTTIVQETRFPDDGTVALTIGKGPVRTFALHLRIPRWAAGATMALNGKPVAAAAAPGSFARLHRRWQAGDRLTLTLPFALGVEAVPDRLDRVALRYGPHILAARAEGEVVFEGSAEGLVAALQPAGANAFVLRTGTGPVTFTPISAIVDERYGGYLRITQPPEERVCDMVSIGDTQSRSQHGLLAPAQAGDFIESSSPVSLVLGVDPVRPTYLKCRYSGDDAAAEEFVRLFDIEVDTPGGPVVVATQSLQREAPGEWHELVYPLPAAATRGARRIAVRFVPKGLAGKPGRVGRLFDRIQTHYYA